MYAGLKNQISAIEKEISDLNSKVVDKKIPEEAKVYFRKEVTKKEVQKASLQKDLYKIEGFVGI